MAFIKKYGSVVVLIVLLLVSGISVSECNRNATLRESIAQQKEIYNALKKSSESEIAKLNEDLKTLNSAIDCSNDLIREKNTKIAALEASKKSIVVKSATEIKALTLSNDQLKEEYSKLYEKYTLAESLNDSYQAQISEMDKVIENQKSIIRISEEKYNRELALRTTCEMSLANCQKAVSKKTSNFLEVATIVLVAISGGVMIAAGG